jgi:hypothetical protein
MFNMKALAVVALLGAVAAPAAAHDPARSTDIDARSPVAAIPDDAQVAPGDRLEGQVFAVDAEQGRMLLATDAGMIALLADPVDLAGVEVGDTIEVVMVESPPAAPARLGDRG